MSNLLPSIPKIYALGQRHNAGIFEDLVQVEEKIDGSQFSFGKVGGKLECRSKGQTVDQSDPGMFRLAVETAQHLNREIDLPNGWIFQCEFLAKPKHNILAYSRAPKLNLVLFDVRMDNGAYVNSEARGEWAREFGIEAVKVFYQGYLPATTNWDSFGEYFAQESQLGGVKIEGVVIKNYSRRHPEEHSAPMTAKIVAPSFKEKKACVPNNPGKGSGDGARDIVQKLTNCLRTEARWLKAIQHLREAGKLVNDNRDIGPLCREIQSDILAEEAEWIKQKLFDEMANDIVKGTVTGFAQFYQKLLANGPSVYQNMVLEGDKLTTQQLAEPQVGAFGSSLTNI